MYKKVEIVVTITFFRLEFSKTIPNLLASVDRQFYFPNCVVPAVLSSDTVYHAAQSGSIFLSLQMISQSVINESH